MNHSPITYNQSVLYSIFALLGKPTSMLDLGCGDGVMVREARAMGVDAVGVDISGRGDITHDLTRYLDLKRRFELILCLEVAEHLPSNASRTLCETISRHKMINGRLVFSAALPQQDGEGHVNGQNPIFWRDMLWETGEWSYREDLTAKLSLILSHTGGPLAHWLPSNVQVF